MRKLSRLAVAIGGFLITMGMFLVSAITLTILGIIDISAFVNQTYLLLFMIALLSIGILDIVAGIIVSKE
jgi:hypothetical protein